MYTLQTPMSRTLQYNVQPIEIPRLLAKYPNGASVGNDVILNKQLRKVLP